MKLPVLILILVLHSYSTSFAQLRGQARLDSLETRLKVLGQDTVRMKVLRTLSFEYQYLNTTTGIAYGREYAQLAEKLGSMKNVAGAYNAIANNYIVLGNTDSALYYLEVALAIDTRIAYKFGMAAIELNTGNLYYKLGENSIAARHYTNAYTYSNELHDELGIAKASDNLGLVFMNTGDYSKAVELFERAIKSFEKQGDKNSIADALMHIGSIHSDRGDYAAALKNNFRALHLFEELDANEGIVRVSINIGNEYGLVNNKDLALQYYFKAWQLAGAIGDRQYVGAANGNIGEVYFQQQKYALALEYFTKAVKLFDSIGDKRGQSQFLAGIGSVYREQKDYPRAMSYYRKAMQIAIAADLKPNATDITSSIGNLYILQMQDSSYNATRQQRLAFADSAIFYLSHSSKERLERGELALYMNDKSYITEAYSYKGENTLALAAYKEYNKYHDSVYSDEKNQEIARAEQTYIFSKKQDSLKLESEKKQLAMQKEMQLSTLKYEYEKKQSLAKTGEERQQLKFEEALKRQKIEADFSKREAQAQAEQQRKTALAKAEQEKKDALNAAELVRQKNLAIASWAVGALLLVIVVVVIWAFRQRQKTNRILAAESEMKALRAQMNPHFIFNSLNSINRYIVKSDATTASNYLTKFAKLMRMILDSSANTTTTLAQEAEQLKLYIEMEMLRFKEQFSFEMNYAEGLDTDRILIPSMIIQPYIENAIWHGLLHKEDEKGHLEISFSAKDKLLTVVIQDNGIGREKASELKSRNTLKQKSYGMKITGDRINIANKTYGLNANLKIEDLKDSNGNGAGTKVILEIPIN
jgi:tetratricopeptide (TPR) repeat protein